MSGAWRDTAAMRGDSSSEQVVPCAGCRGQISVAEARCRESGSGALVFSCSVECETFYDDEDALDDRTARGAKRRTAIDLERKRRGWT